MIYFNGFRAIDLEQEMAQWSLMLRSGTLTSVITSGLFVYRPI